MPAQWLAARSSSTSRRCRHRPISQWHVKLESSGAATAVDILMTAGGNPTPGADWQTYSFDLDIELAGLDLSDLKLVLFFPDWENANGAVARIDNIRLVRAL